MDIVFCARDDGRIAVRHGRWEGKQGKPATQNRHPQRPINLCREHLLEVIAGEIVRVEVVGKWGVVDVRSHETVYAPGVVELDPAQTNIAQLVYAGVVRVLPPAAPAKVEKA
jgi:hypothetical protein